MKDFGVECRDVRFREVGVMLFFLVATQLCLTRFADTRDPPQSETGINRIAAQRLCREWRLGDLPIV